LKGRNLNLFILIIFVFTFLSCKDEKSVNDEEKFARLYVDLMINQEKYKADSVKQKIEQNKIFKKFEVSEKQYYSTLDSYNNDPEKWKTFFEQVKTYVDTLKKDSKRK